MRGFAALALPVGAALALSACAPQSDPGVASRLTEATRETLVAELASVADGPLRPAYVTFLDGMNAVLDGVGDVGSAIDARGRLVILADRLFAIDRRLAEPASATSREEAERIHHLTYLLVDTLFVSRADELEEIDDEEPDVRLGAQNVHVL